MNKKITYILLALAASVSAFAETAENNAPLKNTSAAETVSAENTQAQRPQMRARAMTPEMKNAHIRGMLLCMSDEELADVQAVLDEVKALSAEERAEAAKKHFEENRAQARRARGANSEPVKERKQIRRKTGEGNPPASRKSARS